MTWLGSFRSAGMYLSFWWDASPTLYTQSDALQSVVVAARLIPLPDEQGSCEVGDFEAGAGHGLASDFVFSFQCSVVVAKGGDSIGPEVPSNSPRRSAENA